MLTGGRGPLPPGSLLGCSTACLRHRRTKRLASAGFVRPMRRGTGAEEHAAVEADQRQPLGFAARPARPYESVRAAPKMDDHQPAFPALPARCSTSRIPCSTWAGIRTHSRSTLSSENSANHPYAAGTDASSASWASASHCGRCRRFVSVRFLNALPRPRREEPGASEKSAPARLPTRPIRAG